MRGKLCSGRQRARSDAEKAQREQQILDAAESLFSERPLAQLTLADVAASTGLTKAALYRYFRSKELLFLAVYRRSLAAFVRDMEATDANAFPRQFTATLLAHPMYCRLTAILHVALETGLSEQEARDFKLYLLEQVLRLSAVVRSASGQSEEHCFQFLLQCQQALIGCWHLCHPPETARKAMATPPLDRFRLDFASSLESHLGVLARAFLTSEPATDAPT